MNRRDPEFVRAARTAVANPGAPDECIGQIGTRSSHGRAVVLYAGVLARSKGLLVLAEACGKLLRGGVDFELHLMGGAESAAFERELRAALESAGMGERAVFLGTRSGADKFSCFAASDVFCYPTYFEAETFGLVLVEAMQCELPVVATRWRGVPTSVEDGVNGYLVPIRDSTALAERLRQLLEDPALARAMGRRGREIYLERFTEEHFQAAMEEALASVTSQA
jgi:glycosyltransferase involved in cell wall biosynthesis